MAMPPQANSLSSITHLAGNPPRYPRNPTEQKRDPLVLYIARVPGSRGKVALNYSFYLVGSKALWQM